jgi:peptidylprolyl isomerase
MLIEKKKGFRDENGKAYPSAKIVLLIDGYHAPLTGGVFIDYVKKNFYDNMPIQRAEELIVQTGKAVDGKVRTIPLELFYKQDSEPVYGITSDDDMRATETPALPFQAYGALGMARENEEPDSGNSEFFFLKWLQVCDEFMICYLNTLFF